MAESGRKPADEAKRPLSWTITPVDPKGGEVGAKLRVVREERGLTIDDVAAVLKIRREHIAAIESGRIDDLPGLPYAIGFVRTYAEYLDMDGLDTVRRFKEEIAEPEDDGALTFPVPVSSRKFPTALLIAGPVILAAALYGTWYFLLRGDPTTADAPAAPATVAESNAEAGPDAERAAAETVAPAGPDAAPPAPAPDAQAEDAPARQAETETEATSPTVAPTQPAVTPDSTAATAEAVTEGAAPEAEAELPSSPGAAEPEAPAAESEAPAPSPPALPPVEQAAPTEAAQAPAPESVTENAAQDTARDAEQDAAVPSAGQAAPGPSRVELRATSDSWVVIRDAQSKILFARILGEGESYAVPSLPNLSMVTGNAGALDVYVDGQIIKPLGPMGAIRRDVALDPDQLLARQ